MDIKKARRVVELSKENKRLLLTLWEGDQISSCLIEDEKQSCESCQGDAELCREFIEHLEGQGYEATEIELEELGLEESLPRFAEERSLATAPGEPEVREEPEESGISD